MLDARRGAENGWGRRRQRGLSVVQRELEASNKSQIMCCKLGTFLSVLGGFLQALSGCCCQDCGEFCADRTCLEIFG